VSGERPQNRVVVLGRFSAQAAEKPVTREQVRAAE
jgi:hypothetical protein